MDRKGEPIPQEILSNQTLRQGDYLPQRTYKFQTREQLDEFLAKYFPPIDGVDQVHMLPEPMPLPPEETFNL
jgi:hypothetical protein